MPVEFHLPVDIGNRACDHCGVGLIDRTQGFSEDSKQAQRIGSVYGKLRRAELQEATWLFAIRNAVIRPIDTDTMLIAASLWVDDTTYFTGSIVSDEDGGLWISRIPNNLGFQPQNTPAWEPYFGPLTVSLYDSTVGYYAGELVYTAAGDGKNRVYLSRQNVNTDNPATATTWASTTTYNKNQTVTRSAVAYQSLIDLNTGNDPALAPLLWSDATTYVIGNTVGASNGLIYTSQTNGNINNDPIADDGTNWVSAGVLNPWTTVFVGGTGSLKWLQIGGAEFPMGVTLATPNIIYPLGAGPSSQSATRNVFRLPAGYLKMAPQDPKAGSVSWFGAPTNRLYDDWNLEGNYLVTQQVGVIRLRFVADITDVTAMHDMFCEGLGARIGLTVCEPLTQSSAKINTIAQSYARFMGAAKLANAIEVGPIEPELDDYLACRG